MNFYTYIYFDPKYPGRYTYQGIPMSFLYKPMYIGKGKNDRINYHLSRKKSLEKIPLPFQRTLKKRLKEGYEIYKIKLPGCAEDEAFFLEKWFIARIGRNDLGKGPLLNMTDGGDGASGHKHSSETKKSLSLIGKTKIGNLNNFYGKEVSIEHREKISKANKGKVPWNKGKKCPGIGGRPKGNNNYDVWLKKYGKEEADRRTKEYGEKISKTKSGS